MKRCWIGVGLLLCLLGIGMVTTWKMQQIHDPISEDLEKAVSLAEADQWVESINYVNQTKQKWDNSWGFAASMSDHEPMERINALFSQIAVSAKARDKVTYCLLCAQLAEELEAMGEAHRLAWWNLL